MKKLFFVLFLISSHIHAATAVGPKKAYSVSKNGTLFRGKPSTSYTELSSTIQGTAVSKDLYVSASRQVTVPSSYFEVAGLVIDAVEVPKKSILGHAQSSMRLGLKGGAIGATLSILSGLAINKGWEWLEEQKSWVKNDTVYPSINCRMSEPYIQNFGDFKNASPEICLAVFRKEFPSAKIVNLQTFPNPTTHTFYFDASMSGFRSVQITALITGSPNSQKIPIPDADVDAAVEQEIKGKEADIVTKDMSTGDELPYGYSKPGFQDSPYSRSAQSPEFETSKTTTTNPDGSTSTTTTRERTEYKYDPKKENGGELKPTPITTVTTTTINNTTNETTTNTTVQTKPDKPDDDKDEPPPVPPSAEFPEIKEPELDKTAIPDIVTNTMLGLPLIPTSFTCTNPNFDMVFISFDLPLCEWIEKFRFLFEWFWMCSTAIGIYLLATRQRIGSR